MVSNGGRKHPSTRFSLFLFLILSLCSFRDEQYFRLTEAKGNDDKLCLACDGKIHPSSHHRDAVIFDLEQAVQQLEDHLRNSERKRSSEKKEMEAEVKRLQENNCQKEKQEQIAKQLYAEEAELKIAEILVKARHDEERQRDARRALESEVSDLRALLTAVEQASAEGELRHLNAVGEFVKEKELLQEQVATCEGKWRLSEENLLKAQRDLSGAGDQLEELRTKLNEASVRSHEYHLQSMAYKAAKDELERKIEALKIEASDFVRLRENDRLMHDRELEELQRNFEAFRRRQEEAAKDKRSSLYHKIHRLQKKLKHSHKQVAKLTIECSEMVVHKRECEAQLAVLENSKQAKIQAAACDPSHASKVKALSLELNQLCSRQSKYLSNKL